MQKALSRLKSQVQVVSGRYSDPRKRKDLDQVFAILEKELEYPQLQSQRIMALMRGIMTAQPGTAKAVNEFLRNPKVAKAMQAGGRLMG